ncbi:substrate-binding domain-containing protein [Motiliproteus sp.]|uniref:substrate-binding domain-containing protein n=1 Tax=Motiliproteus sp. TaxID=1898955 RepID=UPI003BAB9F2B
MPTLLSRKLASLISLCLLVLGSTSLQAETLKLATTTSTYNSGLLDAILPQFEQATGTEVHVIAVGTGAALRMGRDGDTDVLLVHAPSAEQQFIEQGHGVDRTGVMYNDFVIVGPAHDPAAIAGQTNVAQALQRVAESGALFVSRGDDSGTHKKEKSLWQQAHVSPSGDWYREAGQGMGKVLQIADEVGGYTLTDRGTWLAYQGKLQLGLLVEGDQRLFNPYSVMKINPQRYADLNHQGAEAFRQWLVSEQTQQQIADFRINGEPLFVPSAVTPVASH